MTGLFHVLRPSSLVRGCLLGIVILAGQRFIPQQPSRVSAQEQGDTTAKPAQTDNAKLGKRWALLIAVDDYANVRDLEFCGKDMEALREQLIAAGFSPDHVFPMHSGVKEAQYQPFKANIEKQLDLVLGLAEKNDIVVVAFSGHGVHIDGQSYLCSSEANLEEPQSTTVSLETVYEKLRRSEATFKLLLVDACRNDPTLEGKKSLVSAKSLKDLSASFQQPPEGILSLTSCAEGQSSMEDKTLGHGVFMYFVLEGLRGAADSAEDGNKDGRVSLLELYEYANAKTKSHVAKKFNDFQTPKLRGEFTSKISAFDLGLAVARVDSATPPPTPTGDKPGLLVAPFGESQAREAQAAWAKHLNTQVEVTNSMGMKLRLIPAGEFQMGSAEGVDELLRVFPYAKKESFADEQPQHRVRITKPFLFGTFEVTKGQFRKFVEDTGYKTAAEKDGKGGWGWIGEKGFEQRASFNWRSWGVDQSDKSPVVNVSWNDSVAFCEWLSRKEGKTYRLPTESEWEYACRAGTESRYYHGDDPEGLTRIGNVADAAAKRRFTWWENLLTSSDGFEFTCPVGQFRPNNLGLYDMIGNAFEWCQDWYGEDSYRNSPVEDPRGAETGSFRVIRGGGWDNGAVVCRAASRFYDEPADRNCSTGFRVVSER